jgi:hypothetical protein
MTPAGRDRMLAELQGAKEMTSSADKQLSAVTQPLADRFGLMKSIFQAEYDSFCRDQGITE